MKRHIITAGPGCGKTYRLMEILVDVLKTYAPEEVAFVSFTKKGVDEGKKRATDELGIDPDSMTWFRTLHSLAFRQLRLARDKVINGYDYSLLSKEMGMKFLGYTPRT